MKTMQVRDAKAGLSSVVEDAEKGNPTIITRHGKPAAMVVPVDEGRRLYPEKEDNLGSFLLTFPGGIELERNGSPMRDVDL